MVQHYNRRCILAQYIAFTPEQKEHAATVDLEEFLLRQGEKLIKSGREKRLASDHSVTINGCEWFDHASNEGGRAVSFVQKFYGKSYAEAMTMLLSGRHTEISCTLCGRLGNPYEQRTGSPQVSSLASKILHTQTEN